METSQILNQLNKNGKISNEPWPDDATLYQPYEAEQILLPENASCLAVKAYLNMCNLPYTIKTCANAEFMSPNGRLTKLPFLCCGSFPVAEFEPIVSFIEQKTGGLSTFLDDDDKADMRTYLSLAENIFTMAEVWISFMNEKVYKQVTAPRNGIVYPWPLNIIQNRSKRQAAMRLLKVHQWDKVNIDDVIEKVSKCCEILSLKYEETKGPYFYNNNPCELDAIVFGHLFTILTTELPNIALAQTVEKFKKLVQFCNIMEKQFFNKLPVSY